MSEKLPRYIRGFLPVFRGGFEGDKDNTLVRVRATSGICVFAVLFSWSTAVVMFYQAFYCGFVEKGGLRTLSRFLSRGSRTWA